MDIHRAAIWHNGSEYSLDFEVADYHGERTVEVVKWEKDGFVEELRADIEDMLLDAAYELIRKNFQEEEA